MCGLCGWFTSENVQLNKGRRLQRARAMEGLLIANQVRGTDSTGVAAIDFEGDYSLYKIAEEPWDFVKRDTTQKLLRVDSPIMIGHTRMTSMGNDVVNENAHPFIEGEIIGAHNGVINNYLEIDKTVNVDSQAVFRLLDEFPGMMDEVFKQINGSCALTWYDARDPRGMYMVAHQNPLSAAIIPAIETIFWSSQSEHLEPIMRAVYGNDVQFIELKRDTVYRLDSSDVYEWQEQKVDFRYSSVSSFRGNYGSDEDLDRMLYESYGIPYVYGARPKEKVEAPTNTSLTVVKDEDEGKAQGQSHAESASREAQTTWMDEEDRYENYWESLADRYQSESGDEHDESESENVGGIHTLTEEQFQQLESEGRFTIDMVEDLPCGYCNKPAGQNAAWDSGMEMLMCRPCITWVDKYGYGATGSYPQPNA